MQKIAVMVSGRDYEVEYVGVKTLTALLDGKASEGKKRWVYAFHQGTLQYYIRVDFWEVTAKNKRAFDEYTQICLQRGVRYALDGFGYATTTLRNSSNNEIYIGR